MGYKARGLLPSCSLYLASFSASLEQCKFPPLLSCLAVPHTPEYQRIFLSAFPSNFLSNKLLFLRRILEAVTIFSTTLKQLNQMSKSVNSKSQML